MDTPKRLVVFCGPSGAGKSTLTKKVLERYPQFALSVSATTRPPRPYEVEGTHYYFVAENNFKELIDKGELLEYEQVYAGSYYGTPKHELERIWAMGRIPLLDLDVQGAARLKQWYGAQGIFVFVHPGSLENLAQRLMDRGTENPESMAKRLERARYELDQAHLFDFVLHNIDLVQAEAQLMALMDQVVKNKAS
jgi:guanylate kinase